MCIRDRPTPAGGGIGRLMALEFAGHNCRLVLWDLNSNGNEETARLARATGATVKTYQVDVSDRDLVYSTASQVRKTKEQVLFAASQVRKRDKGTRCPGLGWIRSTPPSTR